MVCSSTKAESEPTSRTTIPRSTFRLGKYMSKSDESAFMLLDRLNEVISLRLDTAMTDTLVKDAWLDRRRCWNCEKNMAIICNVPIVQSFFGSAWVAWFDNLACVLTRP